MERETARLDCETPKFFVVVRSMHVKFGIGCVWLELERLPEPGRKQMAAAMVLNFKIELITVPNMSFISN